MVLRGKEIIAHMFLSSSLKDMVELLFKKFDVDKDGAISFDDYSTIVTKQPMLLEFLGQCFPNVDGMTVIAYCTNIMSKINFEKSNIDDD